MEEFEASDWRPFREVLAGSQAQLMIGHVTLTAVDPDRAASHSRRVVDGIVRKKWNYQGIVMTDDLVMGAIYSTMSVRPWSRRSMPASTCCWSLSMAHSSIASLPAPRRRLPRESSTLATLRDSEMRLMGRFPAD